MLLVFTMEGIDQYKTCQRNKNALYRILRKYKLQNVLCLMKFIEVILLGIALTLNKCSHVQNFTVQFELGIYFELISYKFEN